MRDSGPGWDDQQMLGGQGVSHSHAAELSLIQPSKRGDTVIDQKVRTAVLLTGAAGSSICETWKGEVVRRVYGQMYAILGEAVCD